MELEEGWEEEVMSEEEWEEEEEGMGVLKWIDQGLNPRSLVTGFPQRRDRTISGRK